nr:hypothetical protein [Tanacetum cinerariifolium]
MILCGADNRPPMLDKDLYDSWKCRMELYMHNREHKITILKSVKNGPLIWPTVEENGVTRTKKYVELSTAEKIQADCDMKATNIILQGTSLTKQERECKLYDAFDKFTHIKGESLHKYYLRFTQLINDMNIYNMKMEQFQVNTKFLNNLPPEWSKFMTDVKIVKDLHTTNFDQLHSYLEQHELHANEVRLLCECNQDPLAFSQMNHQTSSVSQIAYQSPQVSTQPMTESPLMDSGLAVPVFSPRDDPIACLNKEMAFLTDVASLRETMQVDRQGLLNATTVKIEGLDTYYSDCDDVSNAKAVLMANISNYGSDVISEVSHSETYLNDMENQKKLALKEQVDSLEQNLSNQIKEKECLLQTFIVFKSKNKKKEDEYMENEIDLEKKIKELDNIIFKVGQSAHTVHMLTKPQAFYNNIHKQAIGYQNPFYLKKAHRIKPTLYDGIVISNKHVAIPMIDDEETLILEEVEVPKKLPKVSLVNESLKKLKLHLANFDKVVKIRTTPNALTNGLKCSTSNYGSKPTSNKKNDRISQTPNRNIKNNVEAQPRKVNKRNHVVEPIRDVDVKHSLLNANSICATCKQSMFDGVHDTCLLDFVKNMNSRAKSKKHRKQNIWKPTGHVFTDVGFKWKPTGITFTIVGNACPLTRITSANVVPPKKTTSHLVKTQKPELKVHSRKPKNVKNIVRVKRLRL